MTSPHCPLLPYLAASLALLLWCGCGPQPHPAVAAPAPTSACFLMQEDGKPAVARPAEACSLALSPASTYKIPHTLFALDAGIVAGADTTLPWDGQHRAFPEWDRDHTLASALSNSVVWYYQKLAEGLGPDRELSYLRKIGYGNADPSSGLTTFWLEGSLRIKPYQELEFLERLRKSQLPFSPAHQALTRDLLLQPAGQVHRGPALYPFASGCTVHAKSGSVDSPEGNVRWLVGWVEREGRSATFVATVRSDQKLTGSEAMDLAEARLRKEGLCGGDK